MSQINDNPDDLDSPTPNEVNPSQLQHQTGGAPRNTVTSDSGKIGSLRDWITALASIVTAVIALTAIAFSTPADLRAWIQIKLGSYSVYINHPRNGDARRGVTISGTATIPADWSLVVLVQTPDEFAYYLAGAGAVSVGANHRWSLGFVSLGSTDPKQRKNDINRPYRIYALVLDVQGQQQVQAAVALSAKIHSPLIKLTTLPHYTCANIVVVNLVG